MPLHMDIYGYKCLHMASSHWLPMDIWLDKDAYGSLCLHMVGFSGFVVVYYWIWLHIVICNWIWLHILVPGYKWLNTVNFYMVAYDSYGCIILHTVVNNCIWFQIIVIIITRLYTIRWYLDSVYLQTVDYQGYFHF